MTIQSLPFHKLSTVSGLVCFDKLRCVFSHNVLIPSHHEELAFFSTQNSLFSSRRIRRSYRVRASVNNEVNLFLTRSRSQIGRSYRIFHP